MNDCSNKILLLFLYMFCLHLSGRAQQQAVAYSLFHGIPSGQLHEMQNDRPDVAESPFTVDAGLNYGMEHQAVRHYFVGVSCRF